MEQHNHYSEEVRWTKDTKTEIVMFQGKVKIGWNYKEKDAY